MSAIPIGIPGCPEFARCTASMDRARMALASSRRVVISSGGASAACSGLRRQVPRFGSRRAHGAGARILYQSRPLLNHTDISRALTPCTLRGDLSSRIRDLGAGLFHIIRINRRSGALSQVADATRAATWFTAGARGALLRFPHERSASDSLYRPAPLRRRERIAA